MGTWLLIFATAAGAYSGTIECSSEGVVGCSIHFKPVAVAPKRLESCEGFRIVSLEPFLGAEDASKPRVSCKSGQVSAELEP